MAEVASKPNIVVRFLRAIWGTFNFVRRLVFGVIALFLLIAIVSGIAGEVPRLEEKTALVIAPRGAIVEQYSSDPIERAFARLSGDPIEEVQLRDIVRALDAAAKDPMIQRVVLVPDELGSAGMATLIEIGAALDRFKTSNKPVIAYADGMDQRGYLLAAHASKIYLHPEGGVLIEGLARYRTFFKGALDKLGVEPRLFRVGEFKSAGEPYIRTEMSPEAREADLYWMGDLWERYLADVAKLRKLDPAKLKAEIEAIDSLVKAADGDLAKLAKEQGLVDELKTRDQVRAELIEAGAQDPESKSFRQIGVEEYVAAVELREPEVGNDRIAIVVAEGEITDGDQPPGTVGGDSTAKLIRQAREDERVKALVLRVDSPGGGVFPSELIRREVELTRESGKPVVVSMGDLAASGGYWISMNGDHIIASPSTITGSIGIFGLWFNVPQTMEKLGLKTDGTSTTWVAGAVQPTRPYDPRLGDVIQSVIDRGYRQFIGKVAQARGKQPADIDTIARGRVWSGAQAMERGLVDQLGTLQDAIADAATRAKLGEGYRVSYVEKELDPLERFLVNALRSGALAWVNAAGIGVPGAWVLPESVGVDVGAARRLVQDAMVHKPVAMYAHCECDLR
jgi:protease-4